MAGLPIKELLLRGDLKRCMVVSPGNLVEQWQDELDSKFGLPFEIMTNDKLERTDWDLIVCDEAHKMSAHFFVGEVRRTKRHRLGQLLGRLARHCLLLTATPHNMRRGSFCRRCITSRTQKTRNNNAAEWFLGAYRNTSYEYQMCLRGANNPFS